VRALLLLAAAILSAGCTSCIGGSLTGTGTSPAPVKMDMACPAPAIGSSIYRCKGTSACTLSSANWLQLGVVVGAAGEYQDSTVDASTFYTYAGICTDGATLAPASNFYTTETEE
jgi:hypothetical protein